MQVLQDERGSLFLIEGRSDGEPTGQDAMVVVPPENIYRETADGAEVNMAQLGPFLTKLSFFGTLQVDEPLHHADWRFIDGPALVAKYALLHDCERCREQNTTAQEWLQANPGKPLLVGVLYWAADEESA